jgi:hypothetical protein
MNIVMKEGYELTEEIIRIAKGYDVYSCYIDSYTQMKAAEEKNRDIMDKLDPLGVERIKE